MEPEGPSNVQRHVRTPNWTTLALIGGLVVLVLVVAYFASRGNADQDKLTSNQISQGQSTASDPEKLCAGKPTYDLIKHELFRRAAQLRGSDQAAYDKLSAYAVLRMDNPVMESQDSTTGAVNCSGSLSLDLPPGVAVVGGRRTLTSDVDYTVQPAADGSGNVVLLRNSDAIIAPLATLGRTNEPAPQPTVAQPTDDGDAEQPDVVAEAPAPTHEAAPTASYPGHPSFNCANASSKSEIAVCSDSGLSALDVNMANQYRRALSSASPEEQALLRRTRDRFLAYRERCSNRSCIGDAYVGRMREIRDIMEGRWTPVQR